MAGATNSMQIGLKFIWQHKSLLSSYSLCNSKQFLLLRTQQVCSDLVSDPDFAIHYSFVSFIACKLRIMKTALQLLKGLNRITYVKRFSTVLVQSKCSLNSSYWIINIIYCSFPYSYLKFTNILNLKLLRRHTNP